MHMDVEVYHVLSVELHMSAWRLHWAASDAVGGTRTLLTSVANSRGERSPAI